MRPGARVLPALPETEVGRRGRARRHVPDGPFEAQVHDLAHDARGIARHDGKVVFITDALPGEHVQYMRTRKKASMDEGALHAVLNASPDRVTPKCPHFGLCGGCSLQHLSPQAQLRFKQAQMLDNLRRIGGVEPEELAAPLTGPLWGYRRRARLTVKDVPAKERVLVGFRERGKPYVAVLEACEILDPQVGQRLLKLADFIGSLSIRNQLPQIEVAVADNAVALVLRVLESPTPEDIDRLERFSRAEDLWFYLQPGGLETVTALREDTPELYFDLSDHELRFYFEPVDFIQVNGDLNAAMVNQALDWLRPGPEDRVLELFCGLGNFSMPLARHAARVTAVEGEASLVQRAGVNAQRNGLQNLSFHVGDLFAGHADSAWAHQSYDKVLIDPPRAGAQEVLPLIASSGARELLYVSCHPATLARDVGILVRSHGFRLKRAGVMDMFPHTSHVESMALLIRD